MNIPRDIFYYKTQIVKKEELSWYEYFKEYVNYFFSYGIEMIEDHNCESYIHELGNLCSPGIINLGIFVSLITSISTITSKYSIKTGICKVNHLCFK